MGKHVKEVIRITNGVEEFYCNRCKRYKLKKDMYLNTSSITRRDLSCIICSKTRAKQYRHDNPEKRMLNDARKRAKNKGLEFNIGIEDITIPKYCPILELELDTKATYLTRDFAPSLDRIDSTRGYIKGNVRVISFLANSVKRNLTLDLLKKLSTNLPKYMT